MDRLVFIHLDGRGVRLKIEKGERIIRHGDEYIIRGEGMPIKGTDRKGDLRVKFGVEMPSTSWASRQSYEKVSSPSTVLYMKRQSLNRGKMIETDSQAIMVELPSPPPDLELDPTPQEIVARHISPLS